MVNISPRQSLCFWVVAQYSINTKTSPGNMRSSHLHIKVITLNRYDPTFCKWQRVPIDCQVSNGNVTTVTEGEQICQFMSNNFCTVTLDGQVIVSLKLQSGTCVSGSFTVHVVSSRDKDQTRTWFILTSLNSRPNRRRIVLTIVGHCSEIGNFYFHKSSRTIKHRHYHKK